MEFRLLGPLEVRDGDRDLTPARPKQRALLAVLLLRREEVVPGTQLIEALWGEEPPGTAQTALHGHVSALRKLLGAERIRTRPPGYLLQAGGDEVDLARFEALTARARGQSDPVARSACLGEALALWRGEPEAESARLEELRLTALEDRFDADLALGRHHDLVPELEPLVAEHVFRERLRGQLMLALYRCGRQADALSAFQSARRALVDELGIEPGPALQQLELRILRQDPALDAPARPQPARAPVRYARSGELNIAYQVTGGGAFDLVLASGFISHLEKDWEEPRHAHFLERLGSMARLIRFDKRGTGLSDRPPGVPDLERRMDDVRAVMDAAGSERAVLFGYSEGAPMAILFAATYPERTRALILYGAYAKRIDPDDDYPWAPTRAARAAYVESLERDWAFETDMKIMCPSADEAMARWWGERCRAAASPGAVRALMEMNSLVDVRALLPAIRVPALVLNRGTDFDVRVEEGRYIAERIPGARFAELPGADHFVGIDPDQILDVVEPFLRECEAGGPAPTDDRVLVTLVAVDAPSPGWQELVRRHRGREHGERLASFDGPARAVRCAGAIVEAGLAGRAGVHTGEVELIEGRARGPATGAVAALAAAAAPGEVLVSQTVKDLVAGSGLEFEAGGDREWRLLGDRPPEGEPLVGRATELEALERALHAARSGVGSTALVSGEAGIGKSRLVAELAARAGGFQVRTGRCLDLFGTELPYAPFVEALGPLRERPFEEALARLDDSAPLLLVLEDLHWADTSTLDLVVFLAHRLHDRRVLVVATYRADEPAVTDRMSRLAGGVRRSGAALELELEPLASHELVELLGERAQAIAARAEGNPFFAQELLAAAGAGELPRGLRELLLQRVARLDRTTKGILRLASAAGRDVEYSLLSAATALPEEVVHDSLRRAVEHGVLVPDSGRFRFRHALLAEAVYSSLLPGEREDLHRRLAEQLTPGAPAAELAHHWAAAGRAKEAFAASLDAAREAEAVFGLAEALSHLERALELWHEDAGIDLAELCSWAAEKAMLTGAAPRAVELGERAVALANDPVRAGLLHARLGRYRLLAGRRDAALAAFERAVELVPPEPSPERAQVLAARGHALMLSWRHEESRAVCEQALELAGTVGARDAERRALVVLGTDLAYLGDGEQGLATLRSALRLAELDGDAEDQYRAYVCLTDALTMLGQPRESARVAATGVTMIERYGLDHTTLFANLIEALVAAGEWEEADRVSREAVRRSTANWPHQVLVSGAEIETGRGEFDAARAHLDAALASVGEDERGLLAYYPVALELAVWEGRDISATLREAMARTSAPDAAVVRVRLCALALRVRPDGALLEAARRAAAEAGAVTPTAGGWLLLAEAECERSPAAWRQAAEAWERLERPPLVAYCRWREAEALVAAGADASAPLGEARAIAARLGARPLLLALGGL